MRHLRNRGGARAVIQDKKALRELSESKFASGASGLQDRSLTSRARADEQFGELQQELAIDPAIAVRDNMAQFVRKFEMQRVALEESLKSAMRAESERVIDALRAGPHNRILDPVSGMIINTGFGTNFEVPPYDQ